MFMIKEQINKPNNLSVDSIFQIIEIYFADRYKTTEKSDSKLRIKKIYTFQSSGWEIILKQLSFKDSGYFQIKDNHLSFTFDLTKQIIFWTLLTMIELFILWRLFHFSIIISCLLIFVPLLIGWINGLYNLKHFVKFELDAISERMKDY